MRDNFSDNPKWKIKIPLNEPTLLSQGWTVPRMEEAMKRLTHFIALSSTLFICGPVLADSANVGRPFGREVVSDAAKNGEIKQGVQENVPGGLDDVIQKNLADEDDEAGLINGYGREDAPGHK
jgi:hypothetical protein